jgi:hypothetical protein
LITAKLVQGVQKTLNKKRKKKPRKIPNRLGLKLNKNSLKIAISGPPKQKQLLKPHKNQKNPPLIKEDGVY